MWESVKAAYLKSRIPPGPSRALRTPGGRRVAEDSLHESYGALTRDRLGVDAHDDAGSSAAATAAALPWPPIVRIIGAFNRTMTLSSRPRSRPLRASPSRRAQPW